MNKIECFSKCECGAVTLYFVDDAANSIKEENLPSFGVSLDGIERLKDTYCCDHCVNHYGLDICACGSGESPEECTNGLAECSTPRQYYGESEMTMIQRQHENSFFDSLPLATADITELLNSVN